MGTPQRLSFGIKTAQQWTTYEDVLHVWQEADAIPLIEHAWLFDHFIPQGEDSTGPCLEGWTLLSALAAQTQRLRLGIMVTGNTYRPPAVLAKMAATVDRIADGRLDFGIGAAWNELEHVMYDIPLPIPKERIERLDEACELIRRLWTESIVTFRGRYYQLQDARCEPKPVQRPHPPFVIGGGGEQLTLAVVARHADNWNTIPKSVEEFNRKSAILDVKCDGIGRDPNQVTRSVQIAVNLDELSMTRSLSEAYIEAGATHIVFELAPPFVGGSLSCLAEHVLEPMRKL